MKLIMHALADHLCAHRLPALFIDALGWERAAGTHELAVDGLSLRFQAIAHKRGVQVFWCSTDRVVLFNRGLLRKFQALAACAVHEHILVFTSEEPRKQVWAWSVRLPDGRKLRHREHPFFSAAPPGPFLHRLEQMRFTLEEEDGINLVDALDRVRRVLDTTPELELFARKPKYAARSDELARAMVQGDVSAFHRFILLHRGLARQLSKRLHRWFGMLAEDAEQIATIGLIEAARRFRPERGFQFSTYATWWIKQACQRYGPDFALLIRVPLHAFWNCFRHNIDVERLRVASGPSALCDYLSEFELLNPRLAAQWRAYLRARSVGSLSDRQLLREARTITDSTARAPIEKFLRSDTIDQVRVAVGQLHPRDAAVIRLRYGLDGQEYTLEQIGQLMGLSRERIRQIEFRAEDKLRTLLCEEAPPSYLAPDDAEATSPAPSECSLLPDAQPNSTPTGLAVSQDIRTFIQDRSG